MVDLGSAGFDQHYAALGMPVTDTTPPTLRGPDADAAISLPGSSADMGIWSLMGTDVEIVGATGNLTVDDSKADVTKKPTKSSTSIQWLANVGFLADASTLDGVCPTSAIIRIPAGHLTASPSSATRKVEFIDGEKPVGPARFCLSRFQVAIPFEHDLAIRLDRQRVLRFADSTSIVISNTCVCAMSKLQGPNHFYAHYDVVRAKRRPTFQPAGPQPKTPLFPEWCWVGFVAE